MNDYYPYKYNTNYHIISKNYTGDYGCLPSRGPVNFY